MADRRAMINLLLEHKADLNAPLDYNNESLLHLAVRRNQPALLAFLLEKGGRVDFQDSNQVTPLHRAVKAGNSALVRVLLRHRADVNRAMGEDGPLPLHLAAVQGSDLIADMLLRAGASVEARECGSGETPLLKAVGEGRIAVVRLLLAHKAAVGVRARGGDSPLHRAARWGDVGVVRLLLQAKASVQAINEKGRQPLHEANSSAVALELLNQGADPNAKAGGETTPLYIAATAGNLKLAEALLARRAAVDAANSKGETPLHAAIWVYRSSSTSRIGDKKTTTKHVELAENAIRMASLLLGHKANVNATDRRGATPLHRAAGADDINLVRLLLSHKANPDARDSKGRTPLAVAVAQENKRVADLLRRFTKKK
jgi:ankyrin repeat protein